MVLLVNIIFPAHKALVISAEKTTFLRYRKILHVEKNIHFSLEYYKIKMVCTLKNVLFNLQKGNNCK